MTLLISGIISVVLGIIGFSIWWNDFIIAMKGMIPTMLILGGILAVYIGIDAIEDQAREERKRQDEDLQKTREEMEQAKAKAEQYRQEIERLKEETKKDSP
jgi:small neutral amino acid transporter SnatA (MarC family)